MGMTSDAELTAAGASPTPGGGRASRRRRRADEMDVRLQELFAASGAGDVTISGTPACTLSGYGTGRVRCGAR